MLMIHKGCPFAWNYISSILIYFMFSDISNFITVGGLMGFLKSGSQKSLLSGGLSAALLYFVYTQLPTRPVLASSLGLGK